MEIKDVFLGLGWVWAVIQFYLNRKNQQKDKAIEKRFDVYSTFMKKNDEVMQSIRQDPKMMYGIPTELMRKIITGNVDEINEALLKFNDELIEFTKRSLQPVTILYQELSNLKLVCSDELLIKINEYKILADDFTNEFQIILSKMSTNRDLNNTVEHLKTIGHSERMERMRSLYIDIEKSMRREIGYYNKK